MKAIILAAGYGNRMRPLTDNLHKALLRVGDKTIIDRMITSLLENNVHEIVVVTGYLDDQVKDYLLETFPQVKFQFVHNPRFNETNNIYSLSLAINAIKIDEDILLIESDLICDPAIIRRIINSTHPNVALLDKFQSGMDGTVVAVRDDVITNIIPPHLQDTNFDFSDKYKTLNIYKFSKEFCNTAFRQLLTYYTKVIDSNCYYELILGILIYLQRETIYAEIVDGEKWSEVDDPNNLWMADYKFSAGKQLEILQGTFGGYWNHDLIDFCFIRNMYFPNHSMLAELRSNLPRLIHNYGSKQAVLDQKLAYFLLCQKDRVTVLNGASQAYPLLKEYWGKKRVLIPYPTFGEYPKHFGDQVIYSDSIGIDVKDLEMRAKDCQVVVIVNPNNPSGSCVPTEWIFKFAESNPDKTVLIDESFIEFADTPSIIGFLEKQSLDNIIVLKSLSKSLGIPGIRLGYAYSCNGTFNRFLKERLPIWNLNSLAENFLEIILKHRDSLSQSLAATIRDREEFRDALAGQKYVRCVYPSGANFILVSLFKELKGLGHLVSDVLVEHSIYLKDVSPKFNDGNFYLRLAVRFPHENKKLLGGLSQVILKQNSPAAIDEIRSLQKNML